MIEFLDAPDHVLACKVAGTLTGDEYDALTVEIDRRLGAYSCIGVVIDLTAFTDVTAEAAWKDVRYDLGLLNKLNRFPREALITDKQWMRVLARIASALIPFIEIRTFDPGQTDEALAWAADIDAVATHQTSGPDARRPG